MGLTTRQQALLHLPPPRPSLLLRRTTTALTPLLPQKPTIHRTLALLFLIEKHQNLLRCLTSTNTRQSSARPALAASQPTLTHPSCQGHSPHGRGRRAKGLPPLESRASLCRLSCLPNQPSFLRLVRSLPFLFSKT